MKKGHLVNVGKTNPIQSQYKANQTQLKPIQTQYKPKTNPISEKAKMNVNCFITKGYENILRFRAKAKQTQYKPKKLIPTCRDLVLKSQNFSKRGGNWLIWRIVYWAAAPASCDDSECRRAGRIIWIVTKPSLFGAIKSFIWLSAT